MFDNFSDLEMRKMNRRGELGEQMMFAEFIFMLFLIGGGIVLGTFYFVGEFDFRVSESQLMNSHLEKCIQSGVIDKIEEIDYDKRLDFIYMHCGFSKSVMEFEHYIKICKNMDAVSCIDSSEYIVSYGDFVGCKLNLKTRGVGCSEKTSEINGIKYALLSGSKQGIRSNI